MEVLSYIYSIWINILVYTQQKWIALHLISPKILPPFGGGHGSNDLKRSRLFKKKKKKRSYFWVLPMVNQSTESTESHIFICDPNKLVVLFNDASIYWLIGPGFRKHIHL